MAAVTSRLELVLGSSLSRGCHASLLLHADLSAPRREWGFGDACERLRRWLGRVLGIAVRNEAVGGFGGLIPLGCVGCGCGIGFLDGFLDDFLDRRAVFFGLEELEFLESVAVVTVGGVDAALEAGEAVGVQAEGRRQAQVVDLLRAFVPEVGFADAEAAEEPFGIDEGIDEHALLRSGGKEAIMVLRFESFEVGLEFAADDLRFGVDAGFEGIHGGAGLALRGAGSGGFLRVEAIGVDLFFGWHTGGG